MEDSLTKLLIHADGDNNSTYFVDSKTKKTITANGNVKIDTSQQKFGPSSAYFDGNGDYLSLASNADWNYGTGAFTVDLWFRIKTKNRVNILYSHGGSNAAANAGGIFFIDSDNKIKNYASAERMAGTTVLTNDVWYHGAIIGNGGADGSRNIKMYINGTLEATYTVNYNLPAVTAIFGANESNPAQCMDGWEDEMRVSKGIQRWTTNFTPQTSPYVTNNSGFFNFF